MRGWMVALLLLPALAGCLVDDDDGTSRSVDAAQTAIGTPIHMEHDHLDGAEHTASHNVRFLSWSGLGITFGDNGFANFVLWEGDGERLAFVAIDGDDRGGFVIVDIQNPLEPQVLGSYMVPGSSFQEVRVTPDGRFAVLNIQDLPACANCVPPVEAEDIERRASDDGDYCGTCIHVVDVRDRTAPALSSYTPVELQGTHNMDFQEQDGVLYLYYVGQPRSVAPGTSSYQFPQSTPGNHIWIGRFESNEQGAGIAPVGSFQHLTNDDEGEYSFPHDVIVSEHPATGQVVAYVSHWDGGAITFDVTDPTMAQELDVVADVAPSEALAIHWFAQEDWMRSDGRVIAWSAPEIGSLQSGTGIVRGYDVTDPADVQEISSWQLPGAGDGLFIDGRFIFSPHTVQVDPETGIAAVAHYHAGVWLLDVSDPTDPQHVGFYQPHGDPTDPYDGAIWWKKPNFSPDGYGPNVYMARWDDRGDRTILWVTDRGTGLYALQYTGPETGPLR